MTTFKPLLAESVELEIPEGQEHPTAILTEIPKAVFASPKLDGIRSVIRESGALSRKLIALPNRSLQARVANFARLASGLDGEFIVGDPRDPDCYRKTESAIMSQDGEPNFTFYVFDCTHPDVIGQEYYARMCYAEKLVSDLQLVGAPVVLLEQIPVYSKEDLLVVERDFYEQGFEGTMIRSIGGRYKFGRSTVKEAILLKVVRRKREEAILTGFVQAEKNTNEQVRDELGHAKRSSAKAGKVKVDAVGSLIATSEKWGEIRVGSGCLTDAELTEMWLDPDAYIGRTISFEYRPHGAHKKPRFPQFKGWRSEIDMGEPEDVLE